MTAESSIVPNAVEPEILYDAILIGGGIMSATLGAMLTRLQPDWNIALFERLDRLAGESSASWNNAGTGHSGYCELNYMPDATDPTRADEIAREFAVSRRFWDGLVETGDLDASFVNRTAHMDVVFGDRDVQYLRDRFTTLQHCPAFAGMQYTEDPETIAGWAPLVMEGRDPHARIAATRYDDGTDIDFGALTKSLVKIMRRNGSGIHLEHEITSLSRTVDGIWRVVGRDRHRRRFAVRARFVFVGAGGHTLPLLQKARLPEVRGYAVFPIGAQFLRTDSADVVARHDAKVYGQAASGAPPMSVPHLDMRIVDGRSTLLFGPYATFSTRLLRYGKLSGLFATIRIGNIATLVGAGLRNVSLVRYLVGQLLAGRRRKFAQLRRFYPAARPADWHLVDAGQRAQLIKPDARGLGVLTFGTELVTGSEGTIAGLLGASPGASTAPSIMVDLLQRCFPDLWPTWEPILALGDTSPACDAPDSAGSDAS